MFASAENVVYVTAADKSHELSLIRLTKIIKSFKESPKLYIWDLGLSSNALDQLNLLPSKADIRVFDFSAKPAHFCMDNNSGSYAWKAWCIFETSKLAGGPKYLIWLDAGCVLDGPPKLALIFSRLIGVFMKNAQGKVGDWTHRNTLQSLCTMLNVSKQKARSLEESQSLSAAFIVWNLSKDWVRKTLSDWANLSLEPKLISPEGSSRLNHRYDQSLLNCLLILSAPKFKLRLLSIFSKFPYAFLGLRIHQDID